MFLISMCDLIKQKLTSCCCFVLQPMTHDYTFSLKDTMARRPADPEEELRWMSQEVRGYVEAVLNSLAANVPKVYLPLSFILTLLNVVFII